MPYSPQTWSDNDTTKPLSAARMNTIEGGIQTAQSTGETAQTAAATADAKAVVADGKAVTADGKAVAAQNTANTKPSVGLVLALGG